ncbi:epoxide hydrolase [Microlunatus elymi]|uniref:Epoxide hydrolase n=1 Tax=Microlunatus elymi TaxID=2596828 RepID=A0A516Q5Z1_9ACTN|nr:epoxide hydrolase family protein [Microlunatus elymi]QDP98834.1 epoxide hydrolase [Microlunatus elymi]
MTTPAIEPFRIDIPAADVADLRARLAAVRWPDELEDAGWSYGIPARRLRPLVERWRTGFDWQQQQADLNRLDQFVTEIDGRRLHFNHLRSPRPDAMPLVLVHGWPFADFRSLIEPLTEPASSDDVPGLPFDLVIPTLPGFGFSGPTHRAGESDTSRSAELIKELMARLGYQAYGVHGGDAGGFVATQLGRIDAEHVVGVHLNGPITIPSPGEDASGFDERDRRMLASLQDWSRRDTSSYAAVHSTRPQTLAYALNDSPVGQLAWVADVVNSYAHEPIDDDALLTQVSIGWFTGTIGSSFLLYKESGQWGAQSERSGVPTAVAIFPGDSTIRAIAERRHNLVRWTIHDRGGHFPALEAPDLLIKDLREFFGGLR